MPKSEKFRKLVRSMKKTYLGKRVPEKYQKRYGKLYDADEAEEIAYATGKKLGWRV